MDLFKQFLDERTYLKGVSPATVRYYGCVRQTFESILSEPTKAGMMERVQKLLADGVSPVSVNTYLRGFKAYVRWLHAEGYLKEPLPVRFLKTEQKVLVTLTPDQVQKIMRYTPNGDNERRIHISVLLV